MPSSPSGRDFGRQTGLVVRLLRNDDTKSMRLGGDHHWPSSAGAHTNTGYSSFQRFRATSVRIDKNTRPGDGLEPIQRTGGNSFVTLAGEMTDSQPHDGRDCQTGKGPQTLILPFAQDGF